MSVQIKISANGRVCIPADVRERLKLKDGDTLSLEETDEGLVLRTIGQRVCRAQAISREMLGDKPGSAVEDFLAEKRAEVAREEAKYRREYG